MLIAAVTAIGFFIGSHHEPKPADCESNPGVLVEQGPWHYGVYRNSMCRTAVFVHRYLPLVDARDVQVGVSFGPTSGYSVPFTAWLRVAYGPVALYVVPPLPPLTDHRPLVVGLALRWDLK